MWIEDIKPCKAYIEATSQEVSGVLGFGEINFNAGWIIDEKGRNKYKHGHTAHIPVFKTAEFVKPFEYFSNVHTEKIDFQAYYGSSAETNTFCLVGAKPISEEEHNKITGAKR
jgi:hypothetical protein